MSRLMSVALTEEAVRERRKTVTRRTGWLFLKPGDRLTLCRKVMGRKKGEPLERICDVEVVSVRRERLDAIDADDVLAEGFVFDVSARRASAGWFIHFFCEHMGGTPDQEVTRIEWRYLDE